MIKDDALLAVAKEKPKFVELTTMDMISCNENNYMYQWSKYQWDDTRKDFIVKRMLPYA